MSTAKKTTTQSPPDQSVEVRIQFVRAGVYWLITVARAR
jgi:hypothetical protein